MKKAGFVIIIIGALLTVFSAITFFTKEKVVDIGKVGNKRRQTTPSKLVTTYRSRGDGGWWSNCDCLKKSVTKVNSELP